MTEKLNIIFDLDETLISTLLLKFGNGERYKLHMTDISNIGILTINNACHITFIRPFLDELFEYCYENFNVSFWTAGSYLYCKEVIRIILNEDQYNKTKLILSKYNHTSIIDMKSKQILNDNEMNINCKSLNLLYNSNCNFNNNNTLIVDDNIFVCDFNNENSIRMLPYDRLNKNDTALNQLIEWFKSGNFFSTSEKKLNIF